MDKFLYCLLSSSGWISSSLQGICFVLRFQLQLHCFHGPITLSHSGYNTRAPEILRPRLGPRASLVDSQSSSIWFCLFFWLLDTSLTFFWVPLASWKNCHSWHFWSPPRRTSGFLTCLWEPHGLSRSTARVSLHLLPSVEPLHDSWYSPPWCGQGTCMSSPFPDRDICSSPFPEEG